jgi:two-component system phosphate regulon sensor histidine kinase PhoR
MNGYTARYPSLRAHLMGMLAIFAALFLGLTLYLYSASRSLFSGALQRELDGDLKWMATILADDPSLLRDPVRSDSLVKAVAGHKEFRITLMDSAGRVLADSHVPREEVATLENHLHRPEFQGALAHGRGHAWRYSETLNMDMLYVARRLPDGRHYLRMAAGPGPLGAFQRAAAQVFTLFLGLFLATSLAITWWISRTVSSPLLRLFDTGSGTPRWSAKFREAEVMNRAFEGYVSEARSLAGSLAQERDKLLKVIERLEEGLLILSADGVVTAANPASLRLLGLEPGTDLQGRRLADAVKARGLAQWVGQAAHPERTPVLHVDRETGAPYDLLCRLAPLHAEDPAGEYVLTLLDITEFRHLDRVKSEFVANASHELKTPLSSIKGYSEALMEGAMENARLRGSFVEKIHNNALRLERLVQDLLHLSRLEANPAPREPEALPLRGYVAAAAALHKHGMDGAGLRFENHVPEDLRVVMEPRDLELILNNLIGNAVRYNKAGGKIKVGLEDRALYVKDTGIGIPGEMLPRIFERFYRADASRARKDGTGLGLAIVKHAAHKYGMTVRAESVLDEGSRFVVEIPPEILKQKPA